MIVPWGRRDARLQRLEQASLWVQRIRTSGQDERILEAWLEWCQSDPLNQQAFDDIAAIWETSGQLSAEPRPAGVVTRTMYRRRALVASLAGLGLAGIAATWWKLRPAPDEVLTSEFSSPVGVNSVKTLADGSVLELGAGTRVTVALGRHERRVDLHEGELFVAVHHDTSRPFSVDAGRLEVLATGTAFNVLRTAERTTVTVAEGSVAAFHEGRADAAPNVRLQTGQQLVYSQASHTVAVRQADPRNAIAWRSGTLNFQNEPLSEVITTINRYAARKTVIEDPGVQELSFTGTARTDQIDGWLRALPHAFPVAIVELADGRRLIRPQPHALSD